MNTTVNSAIAKISLGFLLVIGISTTSMVTYAQSRSSELEEIVVTATKREESVQSIASSVSAISGDELEARGVTNFFDYAVSIPNLSFGAIEDGVLSGRGISLRGLQGENTTAVYIDDTPISETIDPRILDLERIEVLRGPAGTLYGARAMGGAIRQITRQPDLEAISGKISQSFSATQESDDFNYLTRGSLNLPLGDKAAVLLSGLYERQAGVFDRQFGTIDDHVTNPGNFAAGTAVTSTLEDVDEQDVQAFQASFIVQPNDRLTIKPRLMYQKTKLDGFPLADIRPDNFIQRRDNQLNFKEGGEDEWTLYTLNFDYDSDVGTVTSATSYIDRETFEFEESGAFINFLFLGNPGLSPLVDPAVLFPTAPDMTTAPVGDQVPFGTQRLRDPISSPIYQLLENEIFTQEFRFASKFDGLFNFVAGAFYQKNEFRQAYQPANIADFNSFLSPTGIGNLGVFNNLVFASNTPRETEEFGLFSEFSFDIQDNLTSILGIRYFDIENELTDSRAGLAAGTPLNADGSIPPFIPTTTQDADGVNLKVALEYEYSDDLFFYGSIAEGFRIGGVNEFTNIIIDPTDGLGCLDEARVAGVSQFNQPTFDSDELISYEIGMKSDVLQNTRINLTGFYIDIEDIQQRFSFSCGFPLTANWGDATSIGAELEFLTRPWNPLTLGLNIGYTDAEFQENVGLGTNGTYFINKGDPLQHVPEWTVSFSADYFQPQVMAGFDFFARFDASFVDESQSRVNYSADSPFRIRKSYEQLNLRVGLQHSSNVSAALFVRNMTDEIANLSDNRSLAAETSGRTRFVTSRPRTVGVELLYKF